jgi:cytochrome c oxidase subunit II
MRKSLSEWLPLLIVFVFLPLILTACGITSKMPVSNDPIIAQDGDTRLANGERIYFTGTNNQGERISYTGEPASGGMMMASTWTCAACHGPEARGGTSMIHMRIVRAPYIRYNTLSVHAGEHGEGEEAEHGDYDLEVFRMAVVDGRHPEGEQLSPDMPRWQMSNEDLEDLFAYLKSIP